MGRPWQWVLLALAGGLALAVAALDRTWPRSPVRPEARLTALLDSDFAVFDGRELTPPRPVYRGALAPSEDRGRRLYRVEAGDTLAGIAERKLGDRRRWRRIFEANRRVLASPDRLRPGQNLMLPE